MSRACLCHEIVLIIKQPNLKLKIRPLSPVNFRSPQVLAPTPSKVGLVLQYLKDQPTEKKKEKTFRSSRS
jgi:hypothetical protein